MDRVVGAAIVVMFCPLAGTSLEPGQILATVLVSAQRTSQQTTQA